MQLIRDIVYGHLLRYLAFNIVPSCSMSHYSKYQMNTIIKKLKSFCQKVRKSAYLKLTIGLTDNNYRVATLSKP